MVAIPSQYLKDVLATVGLTLNDKNRDGQIAPTAHWPGWSPSKDDSITYKVQTAPNEWSEEEYRLTEEDLSSFQSFTQVVQRLSGNKDFYVLGQEDWSSGRRETQAYAVLKRPSGVYDRKNYERDHVDFMNLNSGNSLGDWVGEPGDYAYRSIRYVGYLPKLALFDDVPATEYQKNVLKYIRDDEGLICSGQTTNDFETVCRDDFSTVTLGFEESLRVFISAYSDLEKKYTDFESQFERGALDFSDVQDLEAEFINFESVNETYQDDLKAVVEVVSKKKQKASEFDRGKVK